MWINYWYVLGFDQLEWIQTIKIFSKYRKDCLGLGFFRNKTMEVMEDLEVWRTNLNLLPRPNRKIKQ